MSQTQDMSRPLPIAAEGSQNRTFMSPEVIWDVFQDAKRAGVSIAQVLAVRRHDVHGGSDRTRANAWISKYLSMYDQRRVGGFEDINHLYIQADNSIHSCGHDLMISIAYAWEYGAAAYGDSQYIKPGKLMADYQCNVKEPIKLLLDEQRADRVSTYREIQGCGGRAIVS